MSQLLEQLDNALSGVAVQIACRLVGQDNVRVGGEGPGDGHPLLLSAGEFLNSAVDLVLGKPHAQEQLLRPLLFVGNLVLGDLHSRQHVLQGIEVLQQIVGLEDDGHMPVPIVGVADVLEIFPLEQHPASFRRLQGPGQGKGSGLPRTGRPYDGVELPRLEGAVGLL